MKAFKTVVTVALMGILCGAVSAMAFPGMFYYSGKLTDDVGVPITGTVSITFSLYDAATGGSPVWTETHGAVNVDEGSYTVMLGSITPNLDLEFDGSDKWLGITVGSDSEMIPRHKVGSVPYAMNADRLDGKHASDFWSLSGNSGTTPGTDFLGTTDDQAFEVHVNSIRALRIEPHVKCPNVIGGYYNNSVDAGVYGATIAGGGGEDGTGWEHRISHDYATIGGGVCNTASELEATVSGGGANIASELRSTIGGGCNNRAGGSYSTIGGGGWNETEGHSATVPGGSHNTAFGSYSFAAGRRAKANHPGAFVWADATDADFASTGDNQFLIRAAGGVGIGTTSPPCKFTVNEGDALIAGGKLRVQTAELGAVGGYFTEINGSEIKGGGTGAGPGYNPIHIKPGDNQSAVLLAEDGGNVGIGTTLPQALLEVRKDSSGEIVTGLKITNRSTPASGTGSQITFIGYRDFDPYYELGEIQVIAKPGYWWPESAHCGEMVFCVRDYYEYGGSQAQERMRINNLGYVGIGTASPARRLHVNDVMRLEPRASAPGDPSEGDIYMDSTIHKLMVYDGTTWQACW